MKTQLLLDIASDLPIDSLKEEIVKLQQKEQSFDVPLLLPLVGEFSAGKTTLLNALMDSGIMETGPRPTTTTIYEIHFGCENPHAEVFYADGRKDVVNDFSALKNEMLAEATVVNIFDSSTKVPSSLVLVDTPGLSSPDIKHKQVLIEFLPKADGLLLVMDVNQQLTKSLSNFINVAGIAKHPIYLVLTYCDTKSQAEIEQAKKYIVEKAPMAFKGIACVSAKTGDVTELLNLFSSIQNEKQAILKNSIDTACENIANRICQIIDKLLEEKPEYDNTDNIIDNENRLKRIRREIERLFDEITSEMDDIARKNTREFEDTVFERLEAVVAARSNNYDMEAKSTVASIVALMGNKFKDEIMRLISQSVRNAIEKNNGSCDLTSLKGINVSAVNIDVSVSNLDLNYMGHQYDGYISAGIKVAATAAAAYFGASSAGAEGMLDAVDTATDVIIDGQDSFKQLSNSITGNNDTDGLLEGVISMVTDSTLGKPQRRRAIHNYIDGELAPQYRSAISSEVDRIKESVKSAILNDYSKSIAEIEGVIKYMKQERANNKEAYRQRVKKLTDYKQELQPNK